jgi:hypothetical protein
MEPPDVSLLMTKKIPKTNTIGDNSVDQLYCDPLLSHGISFTNSYCIIFKSLMINSDAERRANGIHSSVATADSIFLFIETIKVELQFA